MQVINISRFKYIYLLLLLSSQTYAASVDLTTLTDLFENLNSSMDAIWQMLTAVAYLTGFSMTCSAIYRLKKFGERTAFMHNSKGLLAPSALFIIGVFLMWSPKFIDIMVFSLFGGSVQSTLSWENNSSGIDWAEAIAPMIETIQVIGFIAFIRGWILVTRCTGEQSQPGSVSKGLIHVIGGTLAINITGTMDVLSNTFGV
ncbi:MAG: hypothetical protein HON55_02360 [Legionellales bacterium]|nr:hypothetical protein [Legionellales bacterium]